MQPYERFVAWQRAHAFAIEIYRVSKGWPPDERYGLTAQARRAAFSVAVNIVEGSARRGRREFRRFLDISYASLSECGYILAIGKDLGFIPAIEHERIEALRVEVARPLFKLMRAMGTDR